MIDEAKRDAPDIWAKACLLTPWQWVTKMFLVHFVLRRLPWSESLKVVLHSLCQVRRRRLLVPERVQGRHHAKVMMSALGLR